jgi:hypothetical protein
VLATIRLQPTDEHGRPVPPDELPLVAALRDHRPAHARLWTRHGTGQDGALGVPVVAAREGMVLEVDRQGTGQERRTQQA